MKNWFSDLWPAVAGPVARNVQRQIMKLFSNAQLGLKRHSDTGLIAGINTYLVHK